MADPVDMSGIFAKAASDQRLGRLKYDGGKPYTIPSYSELQPQREAYAAAAESAKTEKLTQTMREVNAGNARLGNALSYPEAGMPRTWSATPNVEIPTAARIPANVPKFTLPELPQIPRGASGLAGTAGKLGSLLTPIGDALAIADLAARGGSALFNLPAGVQGMAEDGALAGRDPGKFLDARRDRLHDHPEQKFPFDDLLQHLPFIPRKKSSNLPDYLEPRRQSAPFSAQRPTEGQTTGAYYRITSSKGDIYYFYGPLDSFSYSRTEEQKGRNRATLTFYARGANLLDAQPEFELASDSPLPSLGSITRLDGTDPPPQPAPTPTGGDAPSIPQSAPLGIDPSIPPVPQPQPRQTPKPNQAPQSAPQVAPQSAPQVAPRREPSRAPAPAPATNPLPAPTAQPQPQAQPTAQPTSTPGQSPSPSGGGSPLRATSLNPDRFPDSKVTTENGELRAPSLNPDKFPDPAPSTQPDAKAPTSPTKSPDPTIDPTAKPQPEPQPQPQPQASRQCNDPCIAEMQDQQNQNAPIEIKVKIFKACKTTATPATPTGSTPTTPDDGDKATYEEKTIKVPKQEADTYKLLYQRIAKLEALQCNDSNAIAAVPEWWQIRPEAQRSQLVVLFAEVKSTGKLGDSRWSLAIPHYNRGKGFKPKMPDYNKGSWEGILVLKDNSKIIVNAKDRTECTRVINALKINVPVEYRVVNGKAIKAKIGERVNSDLKECRVTAIRADFFSTGQRNMKPDWSIDIRKK